ncbi:MAG: hypothetical protein H7269_03355 [Cellulomonas sp.]|nr:hypothetical protein [Cellulomonas sp.]
MTDNDDFAQRLRARVDEVAPPVTVHTSRVLPRGRHRRARLRSFQVLGVVGAFAVVGASAGGITGATGMWGIGKAVVPAATSPAIATPSAEAPTATPTAAAQAPAQGRYWHTVTSSTGPSGPETSETWKSRELPGIGFSNGDLANAFAMGPVDEIGRFKIDGQWVDMLRDPDALPTQGPALTEVLRASVEPDRRSGSDDDKVFAMATELLERGALLPEALLNAAWDAAAEVPGSTITVGTDLSGRAGEVLTYTGTEGPARLVRDPATGLLLEQGARSSVAHYSVQEFTDIIPLEPTLEMSGCTAWSSC